jgi:hypothetical protein
VTEMLTQEKIEEFVAAWYVALDLHVPVQECLSFASDGVQMVFPEKTLHSINDLAAWYAGGTYSDGEAAPGVINIFFDEAHNVVSVEPLNDLSDEAVSLKVVVAWQASLFVAPEAKSRRVALDATQHWTIQRSDKNQYGMVITSYNAMAEPFVYAPGFARL